MKFSPVGGGFISSLKKAVSGKWLWLIAPALLLPLILTNSGVCYSEKRWPDNLEIVDRTLFGQDFMGAAITLAPAEKMKRAKDLYASEYPFFCRINNAPSDLNKATTLINLMSGRKIYEVECVYPRSDASFQEAPEAHYYWRISSVDACARKILDTSGLPVGAKEYGKVMEENRSYWDKKN